MEKGFDRNEFVTIETTIGDLIEAVTQTALESGKDEEEGYRLAYLALQGILNRREKEEEASAN